MIELSREARRAPCPYVVTWEAWALAWAIRGPGLASPLYVPTEAGAIETRNALANAYAAGGAALANML